jgi:hypothetical protein
MTRAERVNSIFRACLFQDDEIVNGKPVVDPVVTDLVSMTVGFHPQRLEQNRAAVVEIAKEVFSDDFYEDRGGGHSFLQVPFDREGHHWCEHRTAEQLVGLCVALDFAAYPLPKSLWAALPGGVPYIIVRGDRFDGQASSTPS